MLNILSKIARSHDREPRPLWPEVIEVCTRIPPLWDLSNYVAVHPFVGYTEHRVDQAARRVHDGLDAHILPRMDYYRTRWYEGAFDPDHIASAAERFGYDASQLQAILSGSVSMPTRKKESVLTFAERHDHLSGTQWSETVLRWIARWCSVHVADGGAYWKQPAGSEGLFASWREYAITDRTFAFLGLPNWKSWANRLPRFTADAIEAMLLRLEINENDRQAYFYRLLGGLFGWASYLRREPWSEGTGPGAVAELLAIRLCCDAAIAELAPMPNKSLQEMKSTPVSGHTGGLPLPSNTVEDERVLLAFQDALEDGFARRLLKRLLPSPAPIASRPTVQAIFCIDVRSEPMRFHLESLDPTIETLGFAGFFGVAVDWDANGNSARCPVLLRPGHRLRPHHEPATLGLQPLAKHLQAAPAASFSFVEMLGLGYAMGLLGDLLGLGPAPDEDGREPFDLQRNEGYGIAPAVRVDLAAGILKNTGLGSRLARLVLLCGHESSSANNPHAAGLNCGACGGHSGAINARIAAALLNDADVRAGLAARGMIVPQDTHFLAGVHETVTDEVLYFDKNRVPASHLAEFHTLQQRLVEAGARVRRDRAPSLGLRSDDPSLLTALRRRSRDASEVRPEWALARNAAFIAARRSRTRGIRLEGRSFLHEYDPYADSDGSVLNLILSAPMVVASWINWQYFASTVDNKTFGCGNKALHNRIGDIGVVLGNGGDLRTGLSLQSVHDRNGHWYHEPLRLQVIVEAPRERIDTVLKSQPTVRDLIENGWVRLFALDPDSNDVMRRTALGWEEV